MCVRCVQLVERSGHGDSAQHYALVRERLNSANLPTSESEYVTSWLDVVGKLQERVVREFSSADEHLVKLPVADAVHQLRLAAQRFPELCFWMKYNRARHCPVEEGTPAPDVPLILLPALSPAAPTQTQQPTHVHLSDFVPLDGKPLALISLSYS